MTRKLALLAWSVSADAPDLAAAPFVYATAAAAFDAEVEIHFAGPAVKLLIEGVAKGAETSGGKNLYSFMRESANLDVKFFACAMAVKRHLADGEALIPEVCGEAGASAFVARSLDPNWTTLVF